MRTPNPESPQNKTTDIHKLLPSSNVLDVCLVFFSHYNVLRRELKESKKIQNKHEIPYEIQTYTNGITINDLYLCATEKSIEFYQNIEFEEYTNDWKKLAPSTEESLVAETVKNTVFKTKNISKDSAFIFK